MLEQQVEREKEQFRRAMAKKEEEEALEKAAAEKQVCERRTCNTTE